MPRTIANPCAPCKLHCYPGRSRTRAPIEHGHQRAAQVPEWAGIPTLGADRRHEGAREHHQRQARPGGQLRPRRADALARPCRPRPRAAPPGRPARLPARGARRAPAVGAPMSAPGHLGAVRSDACGVATGSGDAHEPHGGATTIRGATAPRAIRARHPPAKRASITMRSRQIQPQALAILGIITGAWSRRLPECRAAA